MIPEHSNKPRAGVSVAVINGPEVLLVKRGKPPYAGLWSLPGGSIRLGESPEAAGQRELFEETGLISDRLVLADAVNAVTHSGDQIEAHFVIVVYATREAKGVLKAGDDATGVAWVASDKIDVLTSTPGLSEAIVKAKRVLGRTHG